MEIELQCFRGNAKIKMSNDGQKVLVLTGKRRKWDSLHWNLYSDWAIAIQGLYRGRYADAIVPDTEFLPALRKIGADTVADRILKARQG